MLSVCSRIAYPPCAPLSKSWKCVAGTAGLWDRLTGFGQAVGLMAQGQQRGVDATGKVFPFKEPSPQLLVRPAVLPLCTV